MQPGTKRIAFGGLALAVVAWFAIDAVRPPPGNSSPPRAAGDLAPIPEVAPKARRPVAPVADAAPAASPASARRALEGVLVGCFSGMREDGSRLTERYRFAADGALEGEFTEVNHDGTPAFHETLRIAVEGGVWRYRPAPFGTPAKVTFALVAHDESTLRFENPAHDFPQVIAYRRVGPTLETRVEGVEGGVAKSDAYSTQSGSCP